VVVKMRMRMRMRLMMNMTVKSFLMGSMNGDGDEFPWQVQEEDGRSIDECRY
jgi:hypothetical protein